MEMNEKTHDKILNIDLKYINLETFLFYHL